MPRQKTAKRKNESILPVLNLCYGPEPNDLPPPETLPNGELQYHPFEIFEQSSARETLKAMKAKTWGTFARIVGVDFDELLDNYGEEIEEVYGKRPKRSDFINLIEYWGGGYWGNLAADPRQVAYDSVRLMRPKLAEIMMSTGFEFSTGIGCGIDAIVFDSESNIHDLRKAINAVGMSQQVTIRKDFFTMKKIFAGG